MHLRFPISLIALIALTSSGSAWADDYGNTAATAAPLVLDAVTSGILEDETDVDYFWFNASASTFYYSVLWNSDGGMESQITDSGDTELSYGTPFSHLFKSAAAGRHHVAVRSYWCDYPAPYAVRTAPFPAIGSSALGTVTGRISAAYEVDAHRWSFPAANGSKQYAFIYANADEDMWGLRSVARFENEASETLFLNEPFVFRPAVPGDFRAIVFDDDHEAWTQDYLARLQEVVEIPMSGSRIVNTNRTDFPLNMDCYGIAIATAGTYRIWLDDACVLEGLFSISVLDEDGYRFASTSGGIPDLSFRCWSGQRIQILVASLRPQTQDYTLNVAPVADDFPDSFWEDFADIPQVVANGVPITGGFQDSSDRDAFKFQAVSGMTYAINSPDNLDLELFQYNPIGDEWTETEEFQPVWTATADGWWGVRVQPKYGACGADVYALSIAAFQDDPDNVKAQAQLLPVGGAPFVGDLKVPGDLDWYCWSMPEGFGEYRITVGPNRKIVLPGLYSSFSAENELTFSGYSSGAGLSYFYVLAMAGEAGTYSVAVQKENRPDFSISSVVLVPDGTPNAAASSPVNLLSQTSPGQKVTAYVHVQNRTANRSSGGMLGLYMDQPTDATPATPATKKISAGMFRGNSGKWFKIAGLLAPSNAPLGGKTFRAFIDCNGTISERQESNNQYTVGYETVPSHLDFTVLDVSWSPARPTPGEKMTAYVTAQNQGTIPGKGGHVTLFTDRAGFVNAPTSGIKKISAGKLRPQQIKTYRFNNLKAPLATTEFVPPGTELPPVALTNLPLLAFIDCMDAARESDETNNQLLAICDVEQRYVDFIIWDVVLNPRRPVATEPFKALVTVQNVGTRPGNAGKVGLWLNAPTDVVPGAVADKSKSAGTLKPGQIKTLTFSGLKVPAQGDKTLRAAINMGALDATKPFESDRANNQSTCDYAVLERYVDYIVTDIWTSPWNIKIGQTFTAYVQIRNIGTTSGNAGYLAIWKTNGVGAATASKSTATLKAGERKLLAFTSLKAPAVAGTYVFKAMVDARTSKVEKVETNNELTTEYDVEN